MSWASYETDIANAALLRLGETPVTLDGTVASLSSAYGSAVAVAAIQELYPRCRDEVLNAHNWDCCVRRELLTRAGKVAVTSITQSSTSVIVAASGHGFEEGDLVTLSAVVGMTEVNGGRFVATTVSAAVSFKLYTNEGASVDSSAYGAYTSGGYAYHDPGDDWDYVYDLPSDCLRVLGVMDNNWSESTHNKWERVARRLYTDQEYAGIRYISRETTVTRWDTELCQAIAACLAYKLATRVTKLGVSTGELFQEYRLALLEARGKDQEGASDGPQPAELWVNQR